MSVMCSLIGHEVLVVGTTCMLACFNVIIPKLVQVTESSFMALQHFSSTERFRLLTFIQN